MVIHASRLDTGMAFVELARTLTAYLRTNQDVSKRQQALCCGQTTSLMNEIGATFASHRAPRPSPSSHCFERSGGRGEAFEWRLRSPILLAPSLRLFGSFGVSAVK
jgi:hypothetical protein